MRIAIVNKTGGGMSGGYREYLRNIIPRMAKHNDVDAILCAAPESTNIQDLFELMPNVRFVGCKPFRFLFRHRDIELLMELRRFSPDVIFVPVERTFCFKNVPVVNMIQNMEPFADNINGTPFIERMKQRIQYMDAKRAVGRSDRFIALSRFVSDFLVTRWNIPSEEIGLVYHGIDVNKNGNGCKPDIIPKDWQDKFIFTAGSIRPARGLEDLLLAMKHIVSQENQIRGLVIAGETSSRMVAYQKRLIDWIQKHNLSSKICWTNSLSAGEMAWCYQNCRMFVMSSRVESFGIIIGEAMAHGCICISTTSPPMPEIFGEAAMYYDAEDPKSLSEAVSSVLCLDNDKRRELSEKAKKRAGDFSWDICAERTVEELKKAVAGGRGVRIKGYEIRIRR